MRTGRGEDEFFREKGFGLTLGFGRQPVLIVVDITYAFTDPASYLGSNLDAEIVQINRLLDSAHEHQVPIIFTVVQYDEADLRDAGVWAKKQEGVSALKAGTHAVRLDERLHRESSDSVILKKYASSFFGTDLVPRLMSHGADTLIVTGCSTSGCVRATAIDACQNGFRPIIPREAVGDRSKLAHNQSLFDLNSRYGDVVSVDEVLAYFKAPAAALSRKRRGRPMAKGYWVGHVDISDPEGYREYPSAAGIAVRKFGGRILTRGRAEVAEGALRSKHIIIEFPDYDSALACYRSEEYGNAIEKRRGRSIMDLLILEGAEE